MIDLTAYPYPLRGARSRYRSVISRDRRSLDPAWIDLVIGAPGVVRAGGGDASGKSVK